MKNELILELNENGSRAVWSAEGTGLACRESADFWRLMADDGYYIEMQIKSSEQSGRVEQTGNVTRVTYDRLVTDQGRILDIRLTLTVTDLGDRLVFDSEIDNRDPKARANELQYPYIELTRLVGDPERDELIRPRGLGERIVNPWTALESAHTEYMSSDYYDIKSTLVYPRPATMAWFGIQSADRFLYIGRHDERTRACCLLNSIAPRGSSEKYLASSVCQYPFARPGEKLVCAPVVVTMARGDWRIGSDIYGAFARSSYFKPVEPREWVKKMTGWQRLILRHQFGEIFWKYEDLPRLWREGHEVGLDTLLVFGWWKGRFDNGYPCYEPDDELGGAEKLKESIKTIREMGGHVILYNNGILIDKKSAFYRDHAREAARIDIDGNEYEDHYKFENNGTVLRNFGYKSFVDACQATDIWREVLLRNGRQKLEFGPDSIFFDQIGGRSKLCFNPAHRHGYRPDDEMHWRRENLRACRALLGPDQAIGTECTGDGTCCEVDYLHGCDFGNAYRATKNSPTKTHFPQMWRRTFPEIIMTNRFIHDERDGFRDDLNHAFIYGFRFDVAPYRCRKISVAGLPEYAEHLKKLLDLKREYAEFFYYGKFVCDTDLSLPSGVRYCEYLNAGGTGRMFALWNSGKEDASFEICGREVRLGAGCVACIKI
ncbi:MAG: hypothetical protein J6V01_02875 [Clostridia bacterium]|nr:hypothetical protein [Clostridia bacterium]